MSYAIVAAVPPASSPDTRERSITRLEFCCVAYLVVPVIPFCGWFLPPLSAAVSVAFLLGGLGALGWRVKVTGRIHPANVWFLVLALGLSYLIGLFPPFSLKLDWFKHFAVLNLLVEKPWPPVLQFEPGTYERLRYYVGWYIVPAGAAKILGRGALDTLILLWTALGVFLVLKLQALRYPRLRPALLATGVFFAFSGADIAGVITLRNWSDTAHLEWWARFVSFDSMIAVLLWVPQHALPAWLIVGLLMNSGRSEWTIPNAGLLLGAVSVWSPFVAIGLLPFFAVRVLEMRSLWPVVSPVNLLSLVCLALPLARFFGAHAERSKIPIGLIWNHLPGYAANYNFRGLLWFYLFELVIIAVCIFLGGVRNKVWFWTSVAILLVIPLIGVGERNDWAMRTSMPALACLAMIAAEILVTAPSRRVLPLALALLVGAVTPAAEIISSVSHASTPEIHRTTFDSLFKEWGNLRGQYFAPYP